MPTESTKTLWTREHPEPPKQSPSDWYWFKYDNEDEEFVLEVWPNRKCWLKGCWGPKVRHRKFVPPEEEVEPKKKRKKK